MFKIVAAGVAAASVLVALAGPVSAVPADGLPAAAALSSSTLQRWEKSLPPLTAGDYRATGIARSADGTPYEYSKITLNKGRSRLQFGASPTTMKWVFLDDGTTTCFRQSATEDTRGASPGSDKTARWTCEKGRSAMNLLELAYLDPRSAIGALSTVYPDMTFALTAGRSGTSPRLVVRAFLQGSEYITLTYVKTKAGLTCQYTDLQGTSREYKVRKGAGPVKVLPSHQLRMEWGDVNGVY